MVDERELIAAGRERVLAQAETGDEPKEAAAGGAEVGGDVAAVQENDRAGISRENTDQDVASGDAIGGGGEGKNLEGEYEGEHMRYR